MKKRRYHHLTLGYAGLCLLLSSLHSGSAPAADSASDQVLPSATTPRKELIPWNSLISATRLSERLKFGNTIVVDVRSAGEYSRGHLPGALNLPADNWRTPAIAAPGPGSSQDIFRLADGKPDVTRYEKLLGAAGITRNDQVVICGNHGGRADGSVPAMILHWLGHEHLAFLDGVGTHQWEKTGNPLSAKPENRPPAIYVARPIPKYIWNLEDVLANLRSPEVLFLDTRSPEEYAGSNLMGNRRGGHIPGAINLDYVELLQAPEQTAVSRDKAASLLKQRGVTPDKTVVLYCQTATRVSLLALMLRDLGFTKVAIYDASWFEYGNLEHTPVTAGPKP